MIIRIIIYAAIAVIAIALLAEVLRWMNGSRLISRTQKAYRLFAAISLEALLLMFLFGKSISGCNPLFQISYWCTATALAFIVVTLGLLDVKATLVTFQQQRREMFSDLIGREKRKE
ncbi:MAG: hypothetical protein ABFD46_03335 [Armatimonadota bacterium]